MAKKERRKSKFFHEFEIVGGIVLGVIVLAILLNIFLANPFSVEFCGNGKCADSEIGECKIDCDWCGDNYCQLGESCSFCSDDCGSCNSEAFCGDGVCNLGECGSGCWVDCSYFECEDGICEEEKGENCFDAPNDCKCNEGFCDEESKQCVYQSCGNDFCDGEETYLNCPNDCEGVKYIQEDLSDVNYPIIFVHGHSKTDDSSETQINSFREFQEKLEYDNYFINKGIVLPKGLNLQKNIWSRLDRPVSIRTTYYYDVYDEKGDETGSEDNQYISVYAERLKIVVDEILEATGKNKAIIIAHSMGGLVSREYIRKFGSDKVDKLIMIGTPNHGIYGLVIGGLCESWFSRTEESPECDDMQYDSTFIESLNLGDETFRGVEYYTIAGNCDHNGRDYHDEVVRVGSVYIDGAISNEVVLGNCVSGFGTFHSALIHPSEVQEVYDLVVDFLEE